MVTRRSDPSQRTAQRPTAALSAAPSHKGGHHALALGLALLLAAVLVWRVESNVDFGFHLAAGRYIVEHRSWPTTDPFTYTRADARYVDMNGLFQVLLALSWGAAGAVGKNLLMAGLTLAATGMLWIHARRRCVTAPGLLLAGFTLGLLAWEMRFLSRPELASFLLLAFQLWLLRRHSEDGQPIWLWITPIVQLVWVYAHSLALIGLAVMGLYAAAHVLGPRRRSRAPWFALAASAAAMLLNPYGFEGLKFHWRLHTRLSGANVFAKEIGELWPLFSAQVHNIWPVVASKTWLIVSLAVAVLTLRRRRPFDLLVLATFGALAVSALRNIGLFVVASLPIALEAAQELLDRWRAWRPRSPAPRWLRAARAAVVPTGAAFVIAQVVLGGYYASDARPEQFGVGLSPVSTPVGAVDFIAERDLNGPIYNELRFGGYLLSRLWPRERVFIDGRLEVMGEEFYQRYTAIQAGAGWDAMMRRWNPQLALIATTSRMVVVRLAGDAEWAPVYVDGASVLFARRTPAHAALIAAASADWRAADEPRAAAEAPLAPRRARLWPARLFSVRRLPWEARGRGNAFMLLGLNRAARRAYREALIEAGWDEPSLAFNYAAANLRLGRREEARVWLQRAIEVDPKNQAARERLAELP